MQSIVSDGLSQLMYFIQLSSTNTGKKSPSFVDCGAVLDFMLALVSVGRVAKGRECGCHFLSNRKTKFSALILR
jgi:hypothetical protein